MQKKVLTYYNVLILAALAGPTTQQMAPFIRFIDNIHKSWNSFPNEGNIEDTAVIQSEYDFVVIGAGSGGSVVTNRLTEIPKWNVLLLEAGDDEPFYSEVPLAAGANSLTSLSWGYKTDPVKGACLADITHSCDWPRGKVLGGTSVLNFMVYTRGFPQDYDNWEKMGNPGWGYTSVLPYFKKSENIGIKQLMKSKYHGVGGYLNVEESAFTSDLYEPFETAAKELGFEVTDLNGKKEVGFSKVQATIRKGRRCSASKAFLEPIRHRENLHVSKQSRVTKIFIDSVTKKTIGVEFFKSNRRYFVRARKEVILSAGTIGSAQLLMLSGVGPKEHLKAFNIPVIQNLTVGYNLQDHVCYSGALYLLKVTTNFESLVRTPTAIFQYIFYGTGPLTIPGGAEGIAFLHSKYSNTTEDAPDIELVMGVAGMNQLSTGIFSDLIGGRAKYMEELYKDVSGKSSFAFVPVLLAPKSRGKISLRSSDPLVWPSLQPNYFQEIEDLRVLREAAKKSVDIAQTSGFKKLGAKLHQRKYMGCEEYDLMSDDHWECAIRHTTLSLNHMVGTAKMGPKDDPTSVVDHTLKVIGITGLRVVDASVMPIIPRGHVNAAVYMIGEKASDMIKKEWL